MTVCLLLHAACSNVPSEETTESLYDAGRKWYKLQQLDSAIHYLTRAEETITPTTDPTLRAHVYAHIAAMVSINKNYMQAANYYHKALNNYRQAGNRDMGAYTLMDIGNCHQKSRDTISLALSYYDRALALSPNDTIVGEIVRQIGLCYYFYNRHDSARHYLRQSLPYPYRASDQSVALLFLGMSYYDTQQPDSAEHYLQLALDCRPDFRQRVGCYTMLHQVAEAQGDKAAATHYSTLHAAYSDSVGRVDARLSKELQNIESARSTRLEAQKKLRNYGILFFALLTCVTAGLCRYAVKAYRRYKERAQRAEEKTLLAEEKVLQAEKEVQRAEARAQKETERAERAEQRTQKMKAKLQAAEQEQQERLKQLQQEVLQTYMTEEGRALERRRQTYAKHLAQAREEAQAYPGQSRKYRTCLLAACRKRLHWDDEERFTALIDSEFNGFARKIKKQYSNRPTPAANRLCCLLWLDVPQEDIRCIMNYTTDCYRVNFARAAKHFGAQIESELLIALKALVAQDRDGRH